MSRRQVPDQCADADPPLQGSEQRVLDLEQEWEPVDDVHVRAGALDQGDVRFDRAGIAQAVMDDDPSRRSAGRSARGDVERRAPGVLPCLQERLLEGGNCRTFDSCPGVQPRHHSPRHSGIERNLVEAAVVLVRQVPPAQQRDAAVHDDELAVVALFEILERRLAADGLPDTEFDAGPR